MSATATSEITTSITANILRWRSRDIDSRDLAQQAALSVLGSERKGKHPKVTLQRAYGEARDSRRRELRYLSRTEPIEELPAAPFTPPTQLRDAMRKQERELLMRCVSKLSTDDQVLLRMRFAGDMELSTIGSVLGVGAPCVHKRLAKVLVRLRGMLRSAGVEGME